MGFLLNENNRIIYHSDPTQVLTTYNGQSGSEAFFYDDTAANGTRELVFYQPVLGRPWAIVLKVPAQQVQQFALDIALPLSLMIIFLAVVAMVSLRFGLRVVTGSLQSLAAEANRIAQGNLDNPLQVDGVDEVGQLRGAFEQMRSSLQARLEELNRLLQVSQGVAHERLRGHRAVDALGDHPLGRDLLGHRHVDLRGRLHDDHSSCLANSKNFRWRNATSGLFSCSWYLCIRQQYH